MEDLRYKDCKGKAYRLLNYVPQYRFIERDTSTDIPNYHRELCLPSGYTAGKGNRFNRPSMAPNTKKSEHAVLSVILLWLHKCAAPPYCHLPYGGKLSLCLYYVKLLVLCRRNKLLCHDSKNYKPRSYLMEFTKQDTNF